VAEALKAGLKAEPKIRNIVAVASLDVVVDFERITSLTDLEATYEPEQFPGAILRLHLANEKIATILLFASGKLVCLGMKNLDDIREAIDKLSILMVSTSRL